MAEQFKEHASKFVIVTGDGFWGTGTTLARAAASCISAGCRKSCKSIVVYAYTGPEALLKEIGVDGMGGINYPSGVTSVRLFGPSTKITLGQLYNDVVS
jgi:hypothetical protein